MLANLNLPEDEGLNPQPNLTQTQTPYENTIKTQPKLTKTQTPDY